MYWQKNELFITTEQEKLDLPYIHHYLSVDSYWAQHIPFETVKRSIEGSICFGMFDTGRQIGFARVVTDKATFGHLADVFIDDAYRSRGLGKWLIGVIMQHPELQGFRTWQLGTRDAHGLYAQFGFVPLDNPERMMRIPNPNVYNPK